ncbi:MAG: ParB/RepB/Spo0J family partition protein, partial [Angelakisella sp.]
NGVLVPILVRAKNSDYEILAGHNRVAAAKLAGLDTVPAIVKDADDDTATLIMLNTNLNQRTELLPSEKARAYKMQLETMKRTAGRPKNNGAHNEHHLKSIEVLEETLNISRAQIQRFIRLTFLIPELLDMVDERVICFVAGVELSYLTENDQETVLYYLENNNIKLVSGKQGDAIRALETVSNAELDVVFDRVKKPKAPKAEKAISIRIPIRLLSPKTDGMVIDEGLLKKLAETIEEYFMGQEAPQNE